MISSRIALLYFPVVLVLTLPGCSRQSAPAPEISHESTYAAARSIIDRCGAIQSSSATVVTEFIQERLLSGFARRNAPRYPVNIKLVACSEPMAFSVGDGKIIISTGLIQHLPNEAELAFVIAHELAHDALHHQITLLETAGESSPSAVARVLELEADRLAIGVMALAGYDPRGAISALSLLSNFTLTTSAIAGHPSTEERIQQLRDEITNSGWQPPGIVNRRPYLKLRAQLSGQPTAEPIR